jgi:hypothetical protein
MGWIGTTGSGNQDAGGGLGGAWSAAVGEGLRPAPFLTPDNRPTLLLCAAQAHAAQLADWGERAGFRCVGAVEPDAIAQRLALTVAVDLILVDARGARMDSVATQALACRHGLPDARLAVLADLAGLDAAYTWADGSAADVLCDPEASDIVGLLVMAAIQAGQRRGEPQLHDPGRDNEAVRIEKLSNEVRRLAAMVERLAGPGEASGAVEAVMETGSRYRGVPAPGEERAAAPLPARGGAPAGAAPSHGEIRALIRARRMREQFLPADLFADPAWDMILDLMAARLANQRVSVSSLCIAAAVPPTTALRWIRQLTERGVFSRIDDPADGRRVFIELTDDAAEAVMAWSIAVRRNGGLLPPA